MTTSSDPRHRRLRRELGVFGAMMMGLGSIVGTGVFVSIGIAAGIAGASVVLAILAAALVAICNGLSSAQLAANHPVSGGTYEYGYKYLTPLLGFWAGWMFLCAKSASAATAALGFGGYLLTGLAVRSDWLIPLALCAVLALTIIVALGIRQSNRTNIVIVSVTMAALILFVASIAGKAWSAGTETMRPFFASPTAGRSTVVAFFEAVALMFVAFTGYGRIATLGEEVRNPRHTIPRAIETTLMVSAGLYILVGLVAVAAVGPAALAKMTQTAAAPLEQVARMLKVNWVAWVVAVGAIVAMLGVLLNLILGLSRVLLAMGRRGDMPGALARVNPSARTPIVATLVIGLLIATLVLLGDVKTTWSFSAFTVLIYYAITNLSALRLSRSERYYPRWVAATGLLACLALAFFVEPRFWLAGLLLLVVGTIWHALASTSRRRTR